MNINKSLYILFKGIFFNVRRVEFRRRWSKERSVYRLPGKSRSFQPIRSLNAHKYFIESNWIAGEFLFARYNPPTVFSLFLSKARPPLRFPSTRSRVILWFFNQLRAIVCVLWQQVLSGSIMSGIKGDSWEPHLVVERGRRGPRSSRVEITVR